MKVSVDAIKALREKTSASISDVRNALTSAEGDEEKALVLLRERGVAIAEKRQGRATGQGRTEAYVHHDGRLAAVVEVNCETDFVARTPEFVQLCRDVAMHVAAMNPSVVRADDANDSKAGGVLLDQPFVKDPSATVGELLTALIAKTGENVVIRRFVRYAIGDATDHAS